MTGERLLQHAKAAVNDKDSDDRGDALPDQPEGHSLFEWLVHIIPHPSYLRFAVATSAERVKAFCLAFFPKLPKQRDV